MVTWRSQNSQNRKADLLKETVFSEKLHLLLQAFIPP